MVVTATNPLPNTHSSSRNRGSDDDQQVDRVGPEQEDSRHGRQREVSTPVCEDVTTTGAGNNVWVPLPRQGYVRLDGTVERSQTAARRTKSHSRSGSSVGTGTDVQPDSHNQAAMLTAGPDSAVWVTVEGADVAQVAARISAVYDVLNRARLPR